MSWKSAVKVDVNEWVYNGLRFATKEEAEGYVADLKMRWTMVDDTRVEESDEPVNFRWVDGKLLETEAMKRWLAGRHLV